MWNRKAAALVFAAGVVLAHSGCTKSNIVQPEEALEPDFNIYRDIVLDEDQMHEDWEDVWLDEGDFPMAAALDFETHEDEEYIDITIVVKDGTSPEDASWYADSAIKGLNDQVAMQDFSYGESEEDPFGGYFQDREIHLKIYEQSQYEADGEPMYETTIPKDTYMTFEIAE